MMRVSPYIEIDHFEKFKQNQLVSGDTFISRKLKDDQRIISVLSDGLGSGVKANVLSTLTATMAMNYVTKNFDIIKTANVIMRTLPVCKTRQISYSTFSIIDIDRYNGIRIIEYDNPSFVLVKNGKRYTPEREKIDFKNHMQETKHLYYSQFHADLGDRLVFFSDGVAQSGIGSREYPFGWGEDKAGAFIADKVRTAPELSARDLARYVVQKAYANNRYVALDDITCGVIHFREPRKLLVMSGPPIDKNRDQELAGIMEMYNGKKVICGGTTANIIARELSRTINVDMRSVNRDIPPVSTMDGADLITEGTLTLGKVIEILENDKNPDDLAKNGATQLVNLLLNSDIINFVIGTKINDAHQDPNVPIELEIRRNIFKKIIQLLEEKYLKDTTLQFI